MKLSIVTAIMICKCEITKKHIDNCHLVAKRIAEGIVNG